MNKLSVPVQMVLALFGISNHLPELCVFSKALYLKWYFIIQKKVNYSQPEVIEKLLIGKPSMVRQSECWMDQKKEKSMHLL